jgi:hypothetical protein
MLTGLELYLKKLSESNRVMLLPKRLELLQELLTKVIGLMDMAANLHQLNSLEEILLRILHLE